MNATVLTTALRVLACERGSTLVGCSSLVLLLTIAAIALLHSYLGAGADSRRHGARVLSTD